MMKKTLFSLLFLFVIQCMSYAQNEMNDITEAYLINADFTGDIHNKATQGNDFFGNDGTFDPVAGWSQELNGWGVAATYSLGHENTLHGKAVPASDAEGNTQGAVLGIVNAWGGWVKYYQNVTFPAGSYQIVYNAYNGHTGTNTTNLTGFVVKGGPSFLSSVNSFPSKTWMSDTIKFTLTEETEGRIQLGLGSANSDSGDKAAPFFDFVKIFGSSDDLESYKNTLASMVLDAQQVLDNGGFYSELGQNLETAIQEANDAADAISLSIVIEAMAGVNQALGKIESSINQYAKLADYISEIESAVVNYEREDLASYHDELQDAYTKGLWDGARIDQEIAKKDSLFYTVNLEPGDSSVFEIKNRIPVDSVEASFPVGFAQAIVNDLHIIGYYDTDKNMCIVYRKLGETTFSKTTLNSKIGWDSHNYIEMIVDNEGYIHISGNLHNDPLTYWRSKNPYDASEFEQIHKMVGTLEDNTTYPKFLLTNSGDLLFHYRYGWSGNGYEVYNIWNPETKTWSRFLDQPLIDGQGQRNAYMRGPYYESDGYYHLYWVWRATPDAATNHDFSYARSKDLKNWESASGDPVANPMIFGESKLKVDPNSSNNGTGVLNGVQRHTIDSQNRIVLCNMKYDALGNSQLYVYRLKEDNTWEEKRITNWLYRFQFGGGGSIVFEIQLRGMRNLGNGEIGVTYYHSQYGTGEIVLDEETLEPMTIREFAPTYPSELNILTTQGTYSKPLEVKINQTGNYLLRWETMAASNDQRPTGAVPGNYLLEVIELDSIQLEPSDTAKTDTVKTDVLSNGKLDVKDKMSIAVEGHRIRIGGLHVGDEVAVISLTGRILNRFTARKEEHQIIQPVNGIYIIKNGRESKKVLIK